MARHVHILYIKVFEGGKKHKYFQLCAFKTYYNNRFSGIFKCENAVCI